MEWLLQLLMLRGRLAFRWRNRRRRRLTESVLRSLRSKLDDAHKGQVPQYVALYNMALFSLLVEQDISAYSECITFARSEWHRQFFARGLAVLLYEVAEDMPQVLGKNCRAALSEFDNGQEWLARIGPIASQFNQFRLNRSDFLGQVRNLVGAHRDHDAVAQLRLMDDLKSIEVYKLSAEFSVPLRQLTNLLTELLGHMHSTGVIVKQVLKAMEARGAIPKSGETDA